MSVDQNEINGYILNNSRDTLNKIVELCNKLDHENSANIKKKDELLGEISILKNDQMELKKNYNAISIELKKIKASPIWRSGVVIMRILRKLGLK
jgi:hypothetical protein